MPPNRISELGLAVTAEGIQIRNYTAQDDDVDELLLYLKGVGISVNKQQFSLCG